MQNPVVTAIQNKQPFIYYHTHVITDDILDCALRSGKSLEVDIACNERGELYVGHPPKFYAFKNLAMPDNLSLEKVLSAIAASNTYMVIDCKDMYALPRITRLIKELGAWRCLFHSWVDELLFTPYPSEIVMEPHWPNEDIPAQLIERLKELTDVPMVVSCRGLTLSRLETERDIVLDKIINVAQSLGAAVNFNLPGGVAPPMDILTQLLDCGVMTLLNVDVVDQASLPDVYVGMSDELVKASQVFRIADQSVTVAPVAG